jgi:uncharacterized membrane protein YwaF
MRTFVRVASSVAGGAFIVLAIIGLGYTAWALMTPMFAVLPAVPVGLSSAVALISGIALLAVSRRRLAR